MIADVDPGSAAVVTAILALIAGIVISIIQATSAARTARISREKMEENVDTGNGKTIGEIAHSLEGAAELILAQLHTNTKETLDATRIARETQRQLRLHMEDVRDDQKYYRETVMPVVKAMREVLNLEEEVRDVQPELHEE